jgi:hypothetical protein
LEHHYQMNDTNFTGSPGGRKGWFGPATGGHRSRTPEQEMVGKVQEAANNKLI